MGSSSSKRRVAPSGAGAERGSNLPDIPAGESSAQDAIPEEPARDYHGHNFPAVSRRGSAHLPPLHDAGTQSRQDSTASQASVSLRLVHLAAKQKVKRKKIKLSRAEDAIVKLRMKQADLLRARVALMEKLRRQSEDMQTKLRAKEESLEEQLKEKEATIFRQNSVTIATGMIERAHTHAEMQTEQVERSKLRQKRGMKEKMAARRQRSARVRKTRRGSSVFGFFGGGKKRADKAPASPACAADGGSGDAVAFPDGSGAAAPGGQGGQGEQDNAANPLPPAPRRSRFSMFRGNKDGLTKKERRASRRASKQAAHDSAAADSSS